MTEVPDKGPVRFLEKQIIKYDRENNLENMIIQNPNIQKWTRNVDIDKELSNGFYKPGNHKQTKIMPHQILYMNLHGQC